MPAPTDSISVALARVVAALRGAGMNATTDPRNITTPGAWVTVHDIQAGTLCGGLDVRADVCLITGDRGAPTSIAELGKLVDLAATVLTWEEPATPATVSPPGSAPTPALVITTTTD